MMAVELQSEVGEEFEFNNRGWHYLNQFAEVLGFCWPHDSDGAEKRSLSKSEASELADAIERGVGSGSPSEIAVRVSALLTQRLVVPSKSPLFANDPIKIEARTIDYWKQFVRFARRGGFSVEY